MCVVSGCPGWRLVRSTWAWHALCPMPGTGRSSARWSVIGDLELFNAASHALSSGLAHLHESDWCFGFPDGVMRTPRAPTEAPAITR